MSDQEALTPRVFLVRHGETSWAKSGRFTGKTEIELTPAGADQVRSTAAKVVGSGNLLDPSRLTEVFVSPRVRARRTYELLLPPSVVAMNATCIEDIAEWDYGDYEGCKDPEIRELRKRKGLDTERDWDIYLDGCEGGESMQQVTERLDRLILRIKEIQQPYMDGQKPVDILLVSHGLTLRCFVKRWLGFSVGATSPLLMLAPGAIAVLSYKNNDVDKPALHVGVELPLMVDEAAAVPLHLLLSLIDLMNPPRVETRCLVDEAAVVPFRYLVSLIDLMSKRTPH